jgi:hypothetical protein
MLNEATMYARTKGGGDILVERTSGLVPDEGVLVDARSFDRFWEFAVDDGIPLAHFELLNRFSDGLGAMGA